MSYDTGKYAFPISTFVTVRTSVVINKAFGLRYVLIDATNNNTTVTLPQISNSPGVDNGVVIGYTITLQRIDATPGRVVTIIPFPGNTFDGKTSVVLTLGQPITLICDFAATKWSFAGGYVTSTITSRELNTIPPGDLIQGMIVYNNVNSGGYTPGMYVYSGSSWQLLATSSGNPVVTASPITGTGILGDPVTFVDGTANGQVWQWNSGTSQWELQVISGSTVQTESPITGDGSSGDKITFVDGTVNGQIWYWNSGVWTLDKINSSGMVTGDGLLTPITLTNGNTPGDVITWNGAAWNPAQLNVQTATGGGLTGNGSTATKLSIVPGVANNVLVNDGSEWKAQTLAVTGGVISGDGVANPFRLTPGLAGQVIGSTNGTTVSNITLAGDGVSIIGNGVTSPFKIPDAANLNYVLTWTPGGWQPRAIPASTITTSGMISGVGSVGDPVTIKTSGVASNTFLNYNGTTWDARAFAKSNIFTGDGVTTNLDLIPGGTNGYVLTWNGTQWTPAAIPSTPTTINTSAPLTGDGSIGDPVTIDTTNVDPGDILRFTGGVWNAQTLNIGNGLTGDGITPGSAIRITTSPGDQLLINSGGVWNPGNLSFSSLFTGTGIATPINLATPASNGAIPIYDGSWSLTTLATSRGISGTGVSGNPITLPLGNSGEVLTWNGVAWASAPIPGAGVFTDSPLTGNGTTGDHVRLQIPGSATDNLIVYKTIGGWQYQAFQIDMNLLAGDGVNSDLTFKISGVTTGSTFVYNGTNWIQELLPPASIEPPGIANTFLTSNGSVWSANTFNLNTSIFAGNGVNSPLTIASGVDGNILINDAGTWKLQSLTKNTSLQGLGTPGSPLGVINGTSPGQVLTWDGSEWSPASPGSVSVTTSGIVVGNGTPGTPITLDFTPGNVGKIISYKTVDSGVASINTLLVDNITLRGDGVDNQIEFYPGSSTGETWFWDATTPGWTKQIISVKTPLQGNGYNTQIEIKPGNANGDILAWNSGANEWQATSPSSTSVFTSFPVSGNGTSIDPVTLATSGLQTNSILVFNGTTWINTLLTPGYINTNPGDANKFLTSNGTAWSATTFNKNNTIFSGDGVSSPITIASGVDGNIIMNQSGVWQINSLNLSPEFSGLGSTASQLKLAPGTSGQLYYFNGTQWVGTSNIPGGQISVANVISGDGSVGAPLKINENVTNVGKIISYKSADSGVPTINSLLVDELTITGDGVNNTLKFVPGSSVAQTWFWDGSAWDKTEILKATPIIGNGYNTPITLTPGSATGDLLTWNATLSEWVVTTPGPVSVNTLDPIIGDGTSGDQIRIKTSGVAVNDTLIFNGTSWITSKLPLTGIDGASGNANTFITSNGTNWSATAFNKNTNIFAGDGVANEFTMVPGIDGDMLINDLGTWSVRRLATESSLQGLGTPDFPLSVVHATTPGDVLSWDGTTWIGAAIPGANVTAPLTGNGRIATPIALSIPGSASDNLIVYKTVGGWQYQALQVDTGIFAGDGVNNAITFKTSGVASGNTWYYNGTIWTPGMLPVSSISTAPGDANKFLVSNGSSWVSNAFNYNSFTFTGNGVSTAFDIIDGTNPGDLLTWDGTNWVPASPSTTTVVTKSPLTGNGTIVSPIALPPGVSNGEILMYDTTALPSPGNWTVTTLSTKFPIQGTGYGTDKLRIGNGNPGDTLRYIDNTTEWDVVAFNVGNGLTGDALTPGTALRLIDSAPFKFLVTDSLSTWTANTINLDTNIFDSGGNGISVPITFTPGTSDKNIWRWYDTPGAWQQDSLSGTGVITGDGSPASPFKITDGATNADMLRYNPGTSEWVIEAFTLLSGGGLQGTGRITSPIGITPGSNGQILIYNNGWQAGTFSTSTFFSGNGVTTPLTFNASGVSTGNIFIFDGIWQRASLQTDLGILGTGVSGDKLRIIPGTSIGQVLTWNGITWAGGALPGVTTAFPITGDGYTNAITMSEVGATNGNALLYKAGDWVFDDLTFNTEIFSGNAVTSALTFVNPGGDGEIFMWQGAPTNAWTHNTLYLGNMLTGRGSAASPLKFADTTDSNFFRWDSGSGAWTLQTINTSNVITGNGTVSSPLRITNGSDGDFLMNIGGGTNWVHQPFLVNTNIFSGNGSNIALTLQTGTDGSVPLYIGAPTNAWAIFTLSTGNTLKGKGTPGNPFQLNDGNTPGVFFRWTGAAWSQQTINTSGVITGDGTSGNPIKLTDGTLNGQLLYWNGTTWTTTATPGVDVYFPLTGNGITSQLKIFDGSNPGEVLMWSGPPGNVWSAQSLTLTSPLTGTGRSADPIRILPASTNGYVLTWNSTFSQWQADPVIVNTSGLITGDGLSGNPIRLSIGSANTFLTSDGSSNSFSLLNLDTNIFAGTGVDSPVRLKNAVFDGSVLIWYGAPTNAWVATQLSINFPIIGSGSATDPIKLSDGTATGNFFRWTGTVWAQQNINTTAPLTGTGTLSDPIRISGSGASVNDTLRWSGSAWVPVPVTVFTNSTLTGNGTSITPLGITPGGANTILTTNGGGSVGFTTFTINTNDFSGDGVTNALAFNTTGVTSGDIWLYDSGQWNHTQLSLNSPLSGTGAPGSPIEISGSGANSGDVLTWNGSSWVPQTVSLPPGSADTFLTSNGTSNSFNAFSKNTTIFTGNAVSSQLDLTPGTSNISTDGTRPVWNSSTQLWQMDVLNSTSPLAGNGGPNTPLAITPGANNTFLTTNNSGVVGFDSLNYNTNVFTGNGIGSQLNFISGAEGNRPTFTSGNWSISGFTVNPPLTGVGTVPQPLGLQNGTNPGDVLTWNGSAWNSAAPASGNVNTSGVISGDGSIGTPIVMATPGIGNGAMPQRVGGAWQFSQSLNGNMIYVDAVYGNNSTGAINNPMLPYLTIDAARAVATAGTCIIVRPGSYTTTTNLVGANLRYYFFPGTFVTYSTVNPFLFNSDVGTFEVSGYANFTSSTGAVTFFSVPVYTVSTQNTIYFECNDIQAGGSVFNLANSTATNQYNIYIRVNYSIQTSSNVLINAGSCVTIITCDLLRTSLAMLISGSNSSVTRIYARKITNTLAGVFGISSSNADLACFFDEITVGGTTASTIFISGAASCYFSGRIITGNVAASSGATIFCRAGTLTIANGTTILNSGVGYAIDTGGVVTSGSSNANIYLDVSRVQGLRISNNFTGSVTGYIRELFSNQSTLSALFIESFGTTGTVYTGGIVNLDISYMYRTGATGVTQAIQILGAALTVTVCSLNVILNVREARTEILSIGANGTTNFTLTLDITIGRFNGINTFGNTLFAINSGTVTVNVPNIVNATAANIFDLGLTSTINSPINVTINSSLLRCTNSGARCINYAPATALNGNTFLCYVNQLICSGNFNVIITNPGTSYLYFRQCYMRSTANGASQGTFFVSGTSTTTQITLYNCTIISSGTTNGNTILSPAGSTIVCYPATYVSSNTGGGGTFTITNPIVNSLVI